MSEQMVICYNRGCGHRFDPNTNSHDACVYHPGVPYFHDAYKGWTCCNKKSTDFTEFLNYKGCTQGHHSNIKPPEPEKPQSEEIEEIKPVMRAPIKTAAVRPDFNSPLVKIIPKVATNFKDQIDNMKIIAPKVDEITNEISKGTVCKNGGCNCEYESELSNSESCVHHPGVPVFHEGLKYWSCCTKRTTDFTAFMNQVGCTTGKHKWISDDDNSKEVKCRFDWHQTATEVVVAIYAKLYHYEQSVVELNPIRLIIKLVFPQQDNALYHIDWELRGIVDVAKATVNMMATKVEVILPKAEPGSWPKLDFPRLVVKEEKPKLEDKSNEDDSDVDLDDIEILTTGCSITELD